MTYCYIKSSHGIIIIGSFGIKIIYHNCPNKPTVCRTFFQNHIPFFDNSVDPDQLASYYDEAI